MNNLGVSIVMPLYNASEYVEEAIRSILNQSYKEFELIIIDDKSKDDSYTKVQQFSSDSRVFIYQNDINKGISETLNYGIKQAKYELVAIMHADDISDPLRIEKQVKYLTNNSEVVLLGTWAKMIGQFKGNSNIKPPISSIMCKYILTMNNCFVHPSVMMRKSAVLKAGMYKSGVISTEDYDLWTKMALIGKISNLPEFLLSYRMHEAQISNRESPTMKSNTIQTSFEYARNIGISFPSSEWFWGILFTPYPLISASLTSEEKTKFLNELSELINYVSKKLDKEASQVMLAYTLRKTIKAIIQLKLYSVNGVAGVFLKTVFNLILSGIRI